MPGCFGWWRRGAGLRWWRGLNRNVALSFVSTISSGCSGGILGYSVMAAYIYLVTGRSNLYLGYSEGAQGLAQLLPGLIAGVCADKFRRDRTIYAAGCLSIVSIVALVLVVLAAQLCNVALSFIPCSPHRANPSHTWTRSTSVAPDTTRARQSTPGSTAI